MNGGFRWAILFFDSSASVQQMLDTKPDESILFVINCQESRCGSDTARQGSYTERRGDMLKGENGSCMTWTRSAKEFKMEFKKQRGQLISVILDPRPSCLCSKRGAKRLASSSRRSRNATGIITLC